MTTPDLLRVAERMVWFKPPEETLAEPFLFLSHAMTYGTVDDLRVVRAHFTDDDLRQALRAAAPGVFDARSWAYWHAVLGVHPAPPLPTRSLPDMTSDHSSYSSSARLAGDRLIVERADGQIRTFFDELRNGTRNYRTIASLDAQIAQEYRGRCVLELLQNAHDALKNPGSNDPRRISFVLNTDPAGPVLLVGNSGRPFGRENFNGICEMAQSPKDPNESVGNKGLGFRSILEVSRCPEIWSTMPVGSDTCFVFRFDPAIVEEVAAAAKCLKQHGLDARSPIDPKRPLVNWSRDQLDEYCKRLSETETDAVLEAKKYLSPYLIPLTAQQMPPEVGRLLDEGHVTVVRLPLDGGRMLVGDAAVRSVTEQLGALQDAASVIFLDDLTTLVLEVDGERSVLNRTVDSGNSSSAGDVRIRRRRLRVDISETAGPERPENTARRFHVWDRVVGGDGNLEEAERIHSVVVRLPNRWPEVRQAVVGVAVEDDLAPMTGTFVVFLPTEKTTGTGAHVNAPFYGSLDRREINFDEPYNGLVLEYVLDLCIDAVRGLVADQPQGWRARAVLDLLSSMKPVGGEREPWFLVSKFRERAAELGYPLEDQALVLCDDGWRTPSDARVMPALDEDDEDDRIGIDGWRELVAFAVVSTELDGRRDAVEKLLNDLNGAPHPTHAEWVGTIERAARRVLDLKLDIDWDGFLSSVLAILPVELRQKPWNGPDPLVDGHFLPTGDGRLIAASDSTKLFFKPVRGIDEVAELVADVPEALRERIAFLHPDVRTHEGQPRRNTDVQRFLDGRFARIPRREELLRDVMVPALPSLPVPHGSPEADSCAEILAWTFRLVGDEPRDTLLPFLGRVPIGCRGGWFPMEEAVFGPGWPERHGDDIELLAAELPDEVSQRLRKPMLLSPDDERWRVVPQGRGELFAHTGVFDGLRLRSVATDSFSMDRYRKELPKTPPPDTPAGAWAEWCRVAHGAVQKVPYVMEFEYELCGVFVLPEIHFLAELTPSGRHAFSRLVLASLDRWNAGWETVTLKKIDGHPWRSEPFDSPLKYWLRTSAWLCDGPGAELPLSRRWLVPESYLRGQSERYSHLDPLSLKLAHRLGSDPDLRGQLAGLGLNLYPTEEDRTGPELLEALAAAWTANRVPGKRFDVFVGQVRDAWRHLDPDRGFPDTFLVRTGRRTFSTRSCSELEDIYLPDNRERARTLQEHGKAIVEMEFGDARRMTDALVKATNVRRASRLNERYVIDGAQWEGQVDGAVPLHETQYGWLPVVLLSVAAHGGANPVGAATAAWGEAADRLRRARVLECDEIGRELTDGDFVVGLSTPPSQWLPGGILAVRRDLPSYEDLASAGQAVLDRQDLLKDLRLVLGSLAIKGQVTPERIESALARSEVDSQAFADICQRWAGDVSVLVDRIRPVLTLLGISDRELDAAATDFDGLTEWLGANLPQWPTSDLLSAARQNRDDHAMGMAAWKALGDIAQLPEWNTALAKLGDRYETVENGSVREQAQAHLEEAKALLRGLARHVAVETQNPDLFHAIEKVSRDFGGDADWRRRWWEVPFYAVLDFLRDRYAEIPEFGPFLDLIGSVRTVSDLRDVFQRRGIKIDPDPYETAEWNRNQLGKAINDIHDLHREWVELDQTRSDRLGPSEMSLVSANAYLHRWTDAAFLKEALRILDDKKFIDACDGCFTVDMIRQRLGLTPEAVEARHEERRRREREEQRYRRTFDVAGLPFEVGGESYRDLFDRLGGFPIPEGPRAAKDQFTPLAETHRRSGDSGKRGEGGGPSVLRSSVELRELIGIVGEIHAYRYLRKEFGAEAVTRDAWVSEIRRSVLPPVAGEPINVNDGHGFDFRFTHRRRKWYVEVKATAGDDSAFELGISEIKAANRLARKKGGRWRILRVRNALSDRPEFDWLPNPFEDGFREYFRLHRGGMRVSYSRQ